MMIPPISFLSKNLFINSSNINNFSNNTTKLNADIFADNKKDTVSFTAGIKKSGKYSRYGIIGYQWGKVNVKSEDIGDVCYIENAVIDSIKDKFGSFTYRIAKSTINRDIETKDNTSIENSLIKGNVDAEDSVLTFINSKADNIKGEMLNLYGECNIKQAECSGYNASSIEISTDGKNFKADRLINAGDEVTIDANQGHAKIGDIISKYNYGSDTQTVLLDGNVDISGIIDFQGRKGEVLVIRNEEGQLPKISDKQIKNGIIKETTFEESLSLYGIKQPAPKSKILQFKLPAKDD